MTNKLILASSSPRRQELLKQVKIPFEIRTANIDETQITTTDPVEKVVELAKLKGLAIPINLNSEVILSADTVVAFNNEIFEKPKNKQEAYEMISNFSGQTHDVYTGVMIRSNEKETVFVEQTKVEFWPLSDEEIESYISTKDPYDKAGGYGIQSIGSIFVKQIEGDYFNVMGLPISKVVRELKKFNICPNFD